MGKKMMITKSPTFISTIFDGDALFPSFLQSLSPTLLVLCFCISISCPNTYICDPFDSYLDPEYNHLAKQYSNINNGISCLSLYPKYLLYHKEDNNNNNNIEETKINPICDIDRNDDNYLYELFHCKLNYNMVYNRKYQRYHYYYHYNLSLQRKMSYHDYLSTKYSKIKCWWNRFSFIEFWDSIPTSWKMTTMFISFTDTAFILIIKYLVFEDNYAEA